MRFGSLFTGIGGLDLGLERAGMQCAWQVEIDPYARRVLDKHWPAVERYIDVRRIKGVLTDSAADWEFVPPVDLICGGFPCQDISVAGKGAGLAGSRSGLWREYARIVDEVRPAWVLIENVPALRTRGLRTVLSDLHACGYDAEWDGLPASAFGAPHRRDRIFVVAYAQRERIRLESRRGRGADGQGSLLAPIAGAERAVADVDGQGQLQQTGAVSSQWRRPGDCDWWVAEPDVERVVYGVPAALDRTRCLGNAVVPQVAEYVGRLILAA